VIESILTPDPAVLEQIPLRIDRDEVLRFQGYKKGIDRPTPEVDDLFEQALREGERLMAPRAVYGSLPVKETTEHRIILDGGTELRIPSIQHFWEAIEAVGIGILTIGDGVERRVRELFDAREFPLAVMLDSVGSAAVECLAEWVNDFLCQIALPDLKVTNRISPGYAGWDVTEQHVLFRLCPGDRAGVTLNDHALMTPLKSISLLVGIGPRANVDHYFTQCRRCWMKACAFRRVPDATSVSFVL
jgi:cobalamin-dependent methionine synthase I